MTTVDHVGAPVPEVARRAALVELLSGMRALTAAAGRLEAAAGNCRRAALRTAGTTLVIAAGAEQAQALHDRLMAERDHLVDVVTADREGRGL